MKAVWHYGEVWEGLWNQQPIVVRTGAMEAEKKLLAQANVMKKLNHNNLVQLYGLCTKKEPILIITELLRFGCLSDYLRGEGRVLKVPALINMATQIASGLAYIEGKGYIHLIWHPGKFLLGRTVCVRLQFLVMLLLLLANNENGMYVATDAFLFLPKWTAHDACYDHCFSISQCVVVRFFFTSNYLRSITIPLYETTRKF
ncbi:Tyrosine-protein kinase SRK2 (Fragment) [Geodia barretti]|uniref:Tyrosine-protein kinase SRK2 n=1 Tax=Geodia barretti TaxID=519541 RepID=A0AA35QXB6_GEOBA